MKRLVFGSTLLTSLALIATGCGGSASGTETDADTDPSVSSTTSGSATDPAETEGTDTEDTGALPVDVPARGGLKITWVEANQGIGVRIGDAGQAVGGPDRTAFLPQTRTTLIRAFWEYPEDWIPRKIKAVLTVAYSDGTELVQEQTVLIDGVSFVGDLKRSFYFGLMADQVVPGMDYKIELWEVEAGWEDIPEGDEPPRAPHEGMAPIGIEDSYQRMKIVVVPFNITNGTTEKADCVSSLADVQQVAKDRFFNYMFMMNPIDTLEVEWAPARDYNGTLGSLGQLNNILANLRFEQGWSPDNPEVYYYGIVDTCSGGVGGAAGLANGIPADPVKSAAVSRVASGVLRMSAAAGDNNSTLNQNSDTFVHEVGHCQGRRHVKCNGEAGVDPDYPIDGGDIGEWGWGVIDFGLKHENVYKDYMTYCNPAWVSTYGWNKVYPTIKELSSWDFEDKAPPDDDLFARYGGKLLTGFVYPNGQADWSTLPGTLDPVQISAAHRVQLVSGDQVLSDLHASMELLDDGTRLIQAAVPLDFDVAALGASEVVWVDDVAATRRAFAASEIDRTRRELRNEAR